VIGRQRAPFQDKEEDKVMRKEGYVVAVAGATGAVGEVMLQVLEERNSGASCQASSLRAVGGPTLLFNGRRLQSSN